VKGQSLPKKTYTDKKVKIVKYRPNYQGNEVWAPTIIVQHLQKA